MNKIQFELILGKICVLVTINYIELYHNQLESINLAALEILLWIG
jgi:hypothetical protein